MSHSIFGWSYPPGCSGPPDEEPEYCEVCGLNVYQCVCPKCPICEETGQLLCYNPDSGYSEGTTALELTPEQIKAMERVIDLEYITASQDKVWEKEEYEDWLSDLEEPIS